MMRIPSFLVKTTIVVLALIQLNAAQAQVNGIRHKIAIFTPLYLDSAFNSAGTYRYGSGFPKQSITGLEFYEGAQFALDSLKKNGALLDVLIYDTKSAKTNLQTLLNSTEFSNVELIIAHHTSPELKLFADAALKKNIPFVSANIPNDGGVNANPYFVLLNSTIKTHCEGIYRHIQKYYSTNPLVVFRKGGKQDDMIKNYFADFGKQTAGVPLDLKYVDLPEGFDVDDITAHLDTAKTVLCVAGNLEEGFGKKLAEKLAEANKTHPVTVIGMPTWDGFNMKKEEMKGLELTYSTPFYNAKVDKLSTSLRSSFAAKYHAKPSDMVYRGYEITLKFSKLLLQYGKDLASNLSSKSYKVFTDFEIQPVLNKQSMTLDYFENKKLYFIKLKDGVITAVY
jgi:hypothetical protein